MGSMSIVHWMIVVTVVVLLFGKGKVSGLMGDVAKGIKSFKKGMQDDEATEAKSGGNPRLTNAADLQTPSRFCSSASHSGSD
jgi:sec-independent protein translocase protein TatA